MGVVGVNKAMVTVYQVPGSLDMRRPRFRYTRCVGEGDLNDYSLIIIKTELVLNTIRKL